MAEATADEAPPETEAEPEPGTSAQAPERTTVPINQDALTMEFIYYGSLLKVVAPSLSNSADKAHLNPWLLKLFRPEYQTSKLREKRNRYLVSLTVSLFNDEVVGIFLNRPSDDEVLVDLKTIPPEPSTAAQWEYDQMWQDTLRSLPGDYEVMSCSVHSSPEECEQDHKLDKVLDQEFQFMLYLIRPYAALLPAEDKIRTADWLRTLCTIHGDVCSSMKAIRNDYMMALLGYLQDLRVVGPFVDYPPDQLDRLDRAAKKSAQTNPVIDPAGMETNQFLLDQPIPQDGAFCYIALTGDLVASNL